MLPDELGGDLPEVAVGEVPRRGDRPKEEIRAHEQRDSPVNWTASPVCASSSPANANGGRCQRKASPVPRRMSRADADAGAAIETAVSDARNMAAKSSGTRHSAASICPALVHVERRAAGPEERGRGRRQDGLLDSRPFTTLNTVSAAMSASAT